MVPGAIRREQTEPREAGVRQRAQPRRQQAGGELGGAVHRGRLGSRGLVDPVRTRAVLGLGPEPDEVAHARCQGKVEQLLNRQPDDDPENLCRKCEGARKDQPVIGMTILWGLKKDGDQFSGGEILDPKNGKVYRAKMKLVDNGAKLEVRGFIGVSLFGRSQTWVRQE